MSHVTLPALLLNMFISNCTGAGFQVHEVNADTQLCSGCLNIGKSRAKASLC